MEKSVIDKTAFEISEGMVHILGYTYCDYGSKEPEPYRIAEYVGFYVPLEEIIEHGLRNVEDERGNYYTQYITDCGKFDAEAFYKDFKPITQEDLNNLDFSDGFYYLED